MKNLLDAAPFGLPDVPQAGWLASSGHPLTLQGCRVQLWSGAGLLLAEHPVDRATGRFGEGTAGTVWLATESSVYLFELGVDGFANVATFEGALPVGADPSGVTLQRDGFLVRVRRSDGAELRRVKVPLRKRAKSRLVAASTDGKVGYFVDGERGHLFLVDLESDEKPERRDINKGAVARARAPIVDPAGARFAAIAPAGVNIMPFEEGAPIKHVAGDFYSVVSSAAGIVAKGADSVLFLGWDGELKAQLRGARAEALWSVLALSADGAAMLCHGPNGVCICDPLTGREVGDSTPADSGPVDEPSRAIALPRKIGPIEDIGRAGDNLVVWLPKHRVQLRSPDGSELLVEARGRPPHCGVFPARDALWRWTLGELQVVTADGTDSLMNPELLSNAGGAGDRLLVLAKHHDGAASALYDTESREATPVKMRSSDNRQHVFLAPGAAYAVGWENLRDIRIYNKCGSRAKTKHRHEDFGLQLLRFSASGRRFAYLTDWWRAYVWDADGKEPEACFESIAGGQIRALAYDDEDLWIAAGDGLYRVVDGEPVLHAEPGPVTRFFVDDGRLLCVVRGGLVSVDLDPGAR